MKQYYECHITMLGDPEVLKPLVEKTGWKFSCINGDPVLGDGIKCYATMFHNIRTEEQIVLTYLGMTAACLRERGVNVIRRKIERVVYDDKIDKVGKCDGACEGCHLDDYKDDPCDGVTCDCPDDSSKCRWPGVPGGTW